jgi:hypothetical protein
MRPDDVREYLKRQPFQPFRVHLSSGMLFDIRNPQMASVGRSALTIALGVEGDSQRFAVVALVHIVWLEVLVPVL